MKLDELKQEVLEANLEIVRQGLVGDTLRSTCANEHPSLNNGWWLRGELQLQWKNWLPHDARIHFRRRSVEVLEAWVSQPHHSPRKSPEDLP